MSWRVRRHLLQTLQEDRAFRLICRRAFQQANGDEEIATEIVLAQVDADETLRDRIEMIALHRAAADIVRDMDAGTALLGEVSEQAAS